jgi:hypothetical protein
MNPAVLSEDRILQQLKVHPFLSFCFVFSDQLYLNIQADSFVLLSEPPSLPLSSASLPAKWVCRDSLLPLVRRACSYAGNSDS